MEEDSTAVEESMGKTGKAEIMKCWADHHEVFGCYSTCDGKSQKGYDWDHSIMCLMFAKDHVGCWWRTEYGDVLFRMRL